MRRAFRRADRSAVVLRCTRRGDELRRFGQPRVVPRGHRMVRHRRPRSARLRGERRMHWRAVDQNGRNRRVSRSPSESQRAPHAGTAAATHPPQGLYRRRSRIHSVLARRSQHAISTVPWRDDRWVDIQLEFLHRHICEPFRIYAFLNSLPADHRSKFYYSSTENIESHAIKLNLLADMVALHSMDRSDLLVFLDGDAFPVGDVVPYAQAKLKEYPLLAIQRRENGGDIQPDPSFCLTTVGSGSGVPGFPRQLEVVA